MILSVLRFCFATSISFEINAFFIWFSCAEKYFVFIKGVMGSRRFSTHSSHICIIAQNHHTIYYNYNFDSTVCFPCSGLPKAAIVMLGYLSEISIRSLTNFKQKFCNTFSLLCYCGQFFVYITPCVFVLIIHINKLLIKVAKQFVLFIG